MRKKRKSRGPYKVGLSSEEKKSWRKYQRQWLNAEIRDIEFLLTFEEWLKLWADSGHFEERGCRKGQYVMARFGDKGPYTVENVRIVTNSENHLEKWANPEVVGRISKLNRERSQSEDFRKATSARLLGNKFAVGLVHSEEFRERQRLRMVGNKNSLEGVG